MKRFSRTLITIFGLVVVGSVMSLIPQENAKVAAGSSTPVTVVNTPLPVHGTVAATQSGPWNVGITGNPSVNIGTPTVHLSTGNSVGINGPVQVGNSATSPIFVRDLDNAARIAKVVEIDLSIPHGAVNGVTTFSVPSGTVFVIETIFVKADVPTGFHPMADMEFFQGGSFATVFFPFVFQGTRTAFSNDLYVGSIPVRIYLQPESGPLLNVQLLNVSTTGDSSFSIILSGYQISCGSVAPGGAGCPLP